ncbi:PREDICTED: uncharacterized protein LOC109359223 [Lupinus angustifolius]|uniref:uncharacterized protein LOC109359223 n=1 Tax=Lupinus angustifolius TaxID=3871 RepID=UPI00092E9812|nr:PREDICTED: uncharacterized protein LOC109359223 [Lupinus angustifolius]
MASAFGWYGPLIDLHSASSLIGDFVQLLVFVHRSFLVQCKSSKGGHIMRTDIQVGDETTPYFGVSLWQKDMASKIAAGDVVLLQNFKIAKYGDIVEARTVQWSSMLCLIHPYESLISRGVEELITGCSLVGTTTKVKLRKVIKWVQQSRSSICNIKLPSNQKIECLPKNWKVLEERTPLDCFSLLEVSQLTTSCKAIVCASIGEMIPQLNARTIGDTETEKIFLSMRVYKSEYNNLVEDLLCIGCQLCGSPLDSECEQNAIPLICSKSSSRLHSVCSIYRPFMLYVWDESDYMPILVKNKAAEILFGNIKAEKVYSSYKVQMVNPKLGPSHKCKDKDQDARLANNPRLSGEGCSSASGLDADKSLTMEEQHLRVKKLNFYGVWLLILKMLLKQGKNSPLKFEVVVDPSLNIENGKFEMVSATMPCFGTK